MTYFPSGLPSKWKVARKGRPSCGSIPFNVDSFGYYFTSRKRSDKPFTKPSTLRGGTSAFLCLDFLQRRLVWILPYVPKTLRQTVYESVNSSWRPSCASISFNVDSFGYYLTSRKRSDKPFMNPSTLRGGLPVSQSPSMWTLLDTTTHPEDAPTNHLRNCHPFVETFLWLDFLQRRLVWTLLSV
ncbi:uncharacterized protein LACBIDRAFT_327419 [Laccaria bicolor S238N-H82]|uniref:Predicted protein n=1 Tax=Laccaria bicolor (strain S238N-H82 / ATCC MYA-4686) TaxID=486041 RepID=B0DB07_LACBS|nr:uncharacterized protein LACBIDRAFT_327419 [Laccaria bicolor S238N-H82]EDR08300.1 predicted protein [Laccaria bicolor S238N-H82]|eukprot:XP_001881370.1 predicted protein [Laccaria bicolor S238N-H82]